MASRRPEVEFRLLGPLEATRDGASLELGPPKQRAVLAALLLAEGRVVSADRLIEAVWGLDPPPRALSSLQAYVSKLRGLLQAGGAELVRRAPGYLLRAEQVDLPEFRRLADAAAAAAADRQWPEAETAASRALALWRGPLLADLADEAWVEREATGLEEAHALCLETLVTALLGQDRLPEAAERARRLAERYPLRERGHWLAMLALYRSGRAPEALAAFRDHAHRLDEELGLQPGPELRELQLAILRQDAALLGGPATGLAETTAGPADAAGAALTAAAETSAGPAGPAATGATGDPGGVNRGAATIVGRDEELATIDRLLGDVVAGRERWLLLTGPAGIGKTRLAEEAVRRARLQGARTVWSSCPDDEGTPAWWPLRPLVRELGGDVDDVFLPRTGVDADTVRFQVYERLSARLVEAAAQAPLLIVVDDVQWLDPASCRCLASWRGTCATSGSAWC